MFNANKQVREFMRASGQLLPTVPGQFDPAQAALYLSLIDEELTEFRDAIAANDSVAVLDGGLDLVWVVLAYLNTLGFPVVDGWAEVARSNLGKIDPVTGVVLKRDDGKVLKPEGWKPPDLQGVLNEAGYAALMDSIRAARSPGVANG